MSEKRFIKLKSEWVDINFPIIWDTCNETGLNVEQAVNVLNEQQSTISALKDIFKDIVTYSKWDSEKPYCSLGIAVDRKTYYKIREILNE